MTSHEDNPFADDRTIPPAVIDSSFVNPEAPGAEASTPSDESAEPVSEGAKMRERVAQHRAAATTGEVSVAAEVLTSLEAMPFRDAMADMLRAQTAWERGDATGGASRVVKDFVDAHGDILSSEDANALVDYANTASVEERDMHEDEFRRARATNGALLDASNKLNLLYEELLEDRKTGKSVDPDRILRWVNEAHAHLEDASTTHAKQSEVVYSRQHLITQKEATASGRPADPITYERVRPLQ